MDNFVRTRNGVMFFNNIQRIAEALESIARSLEQLNKKDDDGPTGEGRRQQDRGDRKR